MSEEASSKQSPRLIVGLILLLLLALVISLVVSNNATKKTNTTAKSVTPPLAYVTISNKGFTPSTLIVAKGTVVIWRAQGNSKTVVVASNPYPKDNDLKSLKSGQLGSGASYRYQFNTSGTFKYHDDLNPTTNGFVVVKE